MGSSFTAYHISSLMQNFLLWTSSKNSRRNIFILNDSCDCKKWSFSCNCDFVGFCFAIKVGLDYVRESCQGKIPKKGNNLWLLTSHLGPPQSKGRDKKRHLPLGVGPTPLLCFYICLVFVTIGFTTSGVIVWCQRGCVAWG